MEPGDDRGDGAAAEQRPSHLRRIQRAETGLLPGVEIVPGRKHGHHTGGRPLPEAASDEPVDGTVSSAPAIVMSVASDGPSNGNDAASSTCTAAGSCRRPTSGNTSIDNLLAVRPAASARPSRCAVAWPARSGTLIATRNGGAMPTSSQLTDRRFLVAVRDDIGFSEDVWSWDDLSPEEQERFEDGEHVVVATGEYDGEPSHRKLQLLPAGFDSWQAETATAALTPKLERPTNRTGIETLGYQLLFSWGQVEMHAEPPVATFEQVLTDARALKAEHGDEHGYFYLQLHRAADGTVSAAARSFTHGDLAADGA